MVDRRQSCSRRSGTTLARPGPTLACSQGSMTKAIYCKGRLSSKCFDLQLHKHLFVELSSTTASPHQLGIIRAIYAYDNTAKMAFV